MRHREDRKKAGDRKERSAERWLLAAIVAEPRYLPELLADFAVRHMGKGVPRAIEKLRHDHPDADEAELRARVVTRGRRAVVSEGALVGGPFLVLIPVAFCTAILRQARTILELAALDGRDPTDRARAAELMVLQGAYEDTTQARQALDRMPRTVEPPPVRFRRWAAVWEVTLRMARLLGIITPGDDYAGMSRVRRIVVQTARWLLLGVVLVVGFVAPLVWLPYMGNSYRRADARLMPRVLAYYFGDSAAVTAPRRRISAPEPDVLAAAFRAVLSLLVPVLLIVFTLLAGLDLAGHRWPVFGLVLAAGSVVVGGLWYRRHRRRPSSES